MSLFMCVLLWSFIIFKAVVINFKLDSHQFTSVFPYNVVNSKISSFVLPKNIKHSCSPCIFDKTTWSIKLVYEKCCIQLFTGNIFSVYTWVENYSLQVFWQSRHVCITELLNQHTCVHHIIWMKCSVFESMLCV
jgi:hypothetical protein